MTRGMNCLIGRAAGVWATMTWWREMASLVRQYIEADRNYRGAMKELKKQIKDQAHGRTH